MDSRSRILPGRMQFMRFSQSVIMTGPVRAGPILLAGQANQLSPRCNLSQLTFCNG